jgi:sec-independent protein translocase protein TatA
VMMIENILSPTHLLLVLAVALIVLGPKRLPDAGKGLGSAIRGFKESLSTSEMREEQPAIASSQDHDQAPDA